MDEGVAVGVGSPEDARSLISRFRFTIEYINKGRATTSARTVPSPRRPLVLIGNVL